MDIVYFSLVALFSGCLCTYYDWIKTIDISQFNKYPNMRNIHKVDFIKYTQAKFFESQNYSSITKNKSITKAFIYESEITDFSKTANDIYGIICKEFYKYVYFKYIDLKFLELSIRLHLTNYLSDEKSISYMNYSFCPIDVLANNNMYFGWLYNQKINDIFDLFYFEITLFLNKDNNKPMIFILFKYDLGVGNLVNVTQDIYTSIL